MSTTDCTATNSDGIARARLRMTRRGRIVLSALIGVVITACLAVSVLSTGRMAFAGNPDTSTESAVVFDYVTVTAGQSLWSLAQKIAPSRDPRDVVSELLNLNNLTAASLQPGQRLAVPSTFALE